MGFNSLPGKHAPYTERESVCMVPRVEESLMPGRSRKADIAGAWRASAVVGGKGLGAGRD